MALATVRLSRIAPQPKRATNSEENVALIRAKGLEPSYDSSDQTILSRAIIAVEAPGPNVPAV